MTFVDAIKTCFRKYADFEGCASRAELWWFTSFLLIVTLYLDVVSDDLSLVFAVATLLPTAAVTTRRLHDTNRSGWLQVLEIIPIIGWILVAVWCAQKPVRPNRYCG